MIKLTKEQLRRIVSETVKNKLARIDEVSDNVNFGQEVGDFVAMSLSEFFSDDEQLDLVTSNAWEMMVGTLGEDQLPVPGRVEDLEPLSELVTTYVLQDESVKNLVRQIAHNILESLMDYRDTPGPRQ
jgi:hypothetical protein